MPPKVYEITAPDGRVFEVEGPEGSTAEEALAQVQAQHAAPQRRPMLETGLNLGRGLLMGGPLGMAAAGVTGAMENIDKYADVAGGATTDALAKVLPSEVAAAGGTAVKMLPAAVGGLVGNTGRSALDAGARRVMQSALKPTSKSLANGDAARAIDTMLREGITATAGGAAALREMITKLKGEVGRLIATSPEVVNRGHVYRELSKTLDDVTQKGAGYNTDRAAVLKAWEEFKNHPLLDKFAEVDDTIPIQAADKVKRATQQAAKEAYRRPSSSISPADEKSQMAIASGLRQGMEAAEPRIAGMNAKLSEYITALHQIEPRAAIAANRDLGGLVPLAESPEAAMLMLADRNPWIKSYVAKVLYDTRRTAPAGTGAIIGASGPYQPVPAP